MKVNLIVGFDINPVVVSTTAARKRDNVRPFAVDDSEFQIAVERCGIYQLPFHNA